MANSVRIFRKLVISDLNMVLQMEGRFRSNFICEKNAQVFLQNPMNWLFACIQDNEIIAFAYGYEMNRLGSAGNMLYIHEVNVLPQYQRQGIGRRMLHNIKQQCKQKEMCKIFLFTEKSNLAACALYETMGGVPAHDDSVVYFFNEL